MAIKITKVNEWDEGRYGDTEFEYNTVDMDEEKGIFLIKEVINGLNISRESLSRFLGGDEDFISRVEKGEDNLTSTMFDSLSYLSTYSCSFPENLTLEEIESFIAIGRIVHNIREMNDISKEADIKSDC